jgi:hypothetical protein
MFAIFGLGYMELAILLILGLLLLFGTLAIILRKGS